ncbi:MAG: type IV secretory system conjugative DNA transfer family protein [Acetobacteraceae bacterium]|nr:type IV secretory system conjugative DNA transfer family protein [Acetobacteraceae bacterium]MBV8520941.1 type IV secretory system conjugative DNA transfer family protein [Acetobacteraceae bacterium]
MSRTRSKSTGEHLHGRPLLTPDEIMRLGPEQAIVLVTDERPYLLADQLSRRQSSCRPVRS